jgi:phosphatidylserine decarboxylase
MGVIFVLLLLAVLGLVNADPAANAWHTADAHAAELAPVVEELATLVNRNATFRAQIVRILDEQNMRSAAPTERRRKDAAKAAPWWQMETQCASHAETCNDVGQPWTFSDVYEFFNDWLQYLPTVKDATKYSSLFAPFYSTPYGSVVVRRDGGAARNWLTKFVMARGAFLDSSLSAPIVARWMADPAIGIHQYVVPKGGFPSFNAFFTRHLRAGARPLDGKGDASVVVSPNDGTLGSMPRLHMTASQSITLKGEAYNITRMMANSAFAASFYGGVLVHSDLQVTNYHRMHAPVSGIVVDARLVGGLYWGSTTIESFFMERRRAVVVIRSATVGLVALVPIGISTISSITLLPRAGDYVAKGEEIGHFAYGGSTIVLLFEKDRVKLSVDAASGDAPVVLRREIARAIGA